MSGTPSRSLISPFGSIRLERLPKTGSQSLRAWDAADEYLLNHLADLNDLAKNEGITKKLRLLIVNDSFGALACALNGFEPVHWSDSFISEQALASNLVLNGLDSRVEYLKSTDPLRGLFDLVLIKVPKTTALLEDQLSRLRPHLHEGSQVIAAGMVKHLSRSAFRCFEKYLGPVTTSLAVKKARLIFVEPDTSLVPPKNPYPVEFTDQALGFSLCAHANVFSRERLDPGARYFLEAFESLPVADSVVDLGCGNGVLGIVYQQMHPNAQLSFVDESYMAVDSARLNYQRLLASQLEKSAANPEFIVGDGLSAFDQSSVDLVLSNPPFHQQHTIAEQVARKMFVDSFRCLRSEGELWVVANRHLRYRDYLKQLFGHCQIASAGSRFTVYRVSKR